MTSALATTEASAAALLDGGARWHACRRSLRQAVDDGRTWCLIPSELLPPDAIWWVEGEVMSELGRCGATIVAPPRAPRLIGTYFSVCLKHPHGPELTHGGMGPDSDRALAMATALHEQTDPVRRVDRRVAFELAQAGLVDDGDVSHLLRAGALDDMPGASGG